MRTDYHMSGLPFVVDPHNTPRDNGHQIDWANVGERYRDTAGGTITVGVGGAAADATTVPVTALPVALPSGTTLDFGGKKFATLTADAAVGATSITVRALATALIAGDVATKAGTGKKRLPAGTVVGTLLGSGKISPRVVTTNPAVGIMATAAVEDEPFAAATGYGIFLGGVFYENLLPDASAGTLASAIKTELNANGTGFAFRTYTDNRG